MLDDSFLFFDIGGAVTLASGRFGSVIAHHVPTEPDLVFVAVAPPRVEAEKGKISGLEMYLWGKIRTCDEAPTKDVSGRCSTQ